MAKKIVDYWSASQVGQFLSCAVSYKHLYVDGLKVREDNIYMDYGSAIHEALAFNYKQKIKSKEDLAAVTEVYPEFKRVFEKLCTKHGFTGMTQYTEFQMIAELVIGKYMTEIAPNVQPIAVEEKFELALKKYPIKILGYIDVITEDGIIIDHKTAGKTYKKDWNIMRSQKDMQGTLYAAAYRKIYGKKEKGVRFDILPRNPKPEFLQLLTPRSDEQVKSMLELITLIDRAVELGVFMPNLSSCSSCPLKFHCSKLPILPKQ